MTRVLIGLVIGGMVAVGFLWFVNVYDTAEGRCDRGDLGACTVLATRADAQRQATEQAAAADATRRVSEAAGLENERAREGRCLVRLALHDAVIRVSGPGADEVCDLFAEALPRMGESWWSVSDKQPTVELTNVCTHPYGWYQGDQFVELTVSVLDAGGQIYGRQVCSELEAYQ